jgi:hypothetical protein
VNGWRNWALIAGVVVSVCGALVWTVSGRLIVLIFGLLMLITAALEPIYGRSDGKPRGGRWQATGERFVDPETGALVTVWYDPETGERRYVEDSDATPPPA